MNKSNKARDGKWFICPADDMTDAYKAGYEGNIFNTEAEALGSVAGLADATNTEEAYWAVAQY